MCHFNLTPQRVDTAVYPSPLPLHWKGLSNGQDGLTVLDSPKVSPRQPLRKGRLSTHIRRPSLTTSPLPSSPILRVFIQFKYRIIRREYINRDEGVFASI